jgi:hypothetical protein
MKIYVKAKYWDGTKKVVSIDEPLSEVALAKALNVAAESLQYPGTRSVQIRPAVAAPKTSNVHDADVDD